MVWCSLSLSFRPYLTRPHGSVVVGSILTTFSAARESNEGSTRPLTKGALKVICRPELHAGEAAAVKSPATICAVGTYLMLSLGDERLSVPWWPPKKKSLFCAIGPPNVPPNWLRFKLS